MDSTTVDTEVTFRFINWTTVSSTVGYVVRVAFGSVALLIVSLYNIATKYSYLITDAFKSILSLLLVLAKAVWLVIWCVWVVLKNFVLVIFNPLLISMKIMDYNSRLFINLILRVLFDTKIENIIKVDYGVENFKLFVQWVQFFNVLCLTGLILGLFAYYYIIKFIFKWTEYEKSQNLKRTKRSKTVIKSELTFAAINEDAKAKERAKGPLINEFLEQENMAHEFDSAALIKQEVEEVDSTMPLSNEEPSAPFIPLPSEAEEDDIANYQTLNSLSTPVSTSNSTSSLHSSHNMHYSTPIKNFDTSSQSNFTPLTEAFRSRIFNSSRSTPTRSFASSTDTLLEHKEDAEQDDEVEFPSSDRGTTVTSSIFNTNRTIMTPITTIDEDEEEK